MHIASKPTVSELKTFIASGSSYAAKIGEKDDLVSAALLIVSMANILKNYDPLIADELKDEVDAIDPMPFFII